MKTKKKLLTVLSLVATVGALLGTVSCGTNSSSSSTSSTNSNNNSSTSVTSSAGITGADLNPHAGSWLIPEGGFDTETPVEINFYSTMGQNLQEVYDLYYEEFHELYPNITVNHTQPGSYDDVRDQIKTELAVGNGPDVAYCYPDHVALYNTSRSVITLDNLMDTKLKVNDKEVGLTDEQLDDYVDGYFAEGYAFGDGKLYTLPFSKSTEVLYYNKTVFNTLNLEVPDHWFSTGNEDKTSMEYVCAKLKEAYPDCTPLGYDSEANWFITMCEQLKAPYTSASGEKFRFNNDQTKDFIKKFKTMYDKGYFTTQTKYGTYTSGAFINVDPTATTSYMSIGSSAGATHQRPAKVDGAYPFDVGIAPIPQADANNKKAISQGPSVCILNHNDPQKVIASWLFVKFLTTSVEFQAEFSIKSGYIPVLKSVQDNPVYKAHLAKADGGDNIAALSSKVCVEQADTYYTSPAFVGSSEARDQVGKVFVGVLDLNASDADYNTKVDKLFSDAIEECKYAAE